MIDGIEREIRSITRQYKMLKQPITDLQSLDKKSPGPGLRIRTLRFSYPDEGIIDDVLNLAQSVWHFKEYLKDGLSKAEWGRIESFANASLNLLICADLANKKKHSTLNHPRSQTEPQLGIMDKGTANPGVVMFDLANNGIVSMCYDGKTKRCNFSVEIPNPVSYQVHILITKPSGVIASKGDAIEFIYSAFKEWFTVMSELGIPVRADHID